MSMVDQSKILVVSGPNLNLLGQREPEVYGSTTLADIYGKLEKLGEQAGVPVRCRQSNAEHEIIGWIHEAGKDGTSGIVINPGGLTHTSVSLRDALLAVAVPFIEVHLSNPQAREPFRHHSYLASAAAGCVYGLGAMGYELALRALLSGKGD